MRHVQADDVAVVPPVQRRAHIRLPVPAAVGAMARIDRQLHCRAGNAHATRDDARLAVAGGLIAARLPDPGLHPGPLSHGQAQRRQHLLVVQVVGLPADADVALAVVGRWRVGARGRGGQGERQQGDRGGCFRRGALRGHGDTSWSSRRVAAGCTSNRR